MRSTLPHSLPFAALFHLVLLVPLTLMLIGVVPLSQYTDNRKLASAPTWSSLRERPLQESRDALERFINDRFGARNLLIWMNNLASYRLLGELPTADAIAGRNGWLFLRASTRVTSECKPLPAPRLAAIGQELGRRNQLVEEAGGHYLVVLAPDKESIYPEHLPFYLRPTTCEKPGAQIGATLASGTHVAFLDLAPALRAAKDRFKVYFSSDTHWSQVGAYLAYRELMRTLLPLLPELGPLPEEGTDVRIEERDVPGGDLAAMAYMREEFTETAPAISVPSSTLASVVASSHPRHVYFQALETPAAPVAGTLIVFGDSFFFNTKLKDLLARHFRRAIFIRDQKRIFDSALVAEERPVLVIQASIERNVSAF